MRKLISTAVVFGLTAVLAGCPAGDGKTSKTSKTAAGKTAAGKTGASGGAKKSDGPDASHVKKGQKYHFADRITDNATMKMVMKSHWEITDVTADEVKYDMVMTNAIEMKNPNIPKQAPKTTKTPGKYPLKVPEAKTAAKPKDAPKPIKEETLKIGGIDFPCKVYETAGQQNWISNKFPGLIKSEKDGKVTYELKDIK